MTNKELIKQLNELDPKAEIVIYNPYCNNCGNTGESDDCSGDGHFLDVDYLDYTENQIDVICK